MSSCPDPAQLRDLLDGTLADPDQSGLRAHLDTCERCQQALDALVADRGAWADVARHLGGARAEVNAADDTRTHPGADVDLPLDFLAPSDRPDALGRLGHYEVLNVVGRGGMGVVLRAFDDRLHRVVAIKVMALQLATSATARQRFVREARAAAAVSHDHVVTIHAVEEAGGLPYLAMQYVSGVSLQERLDRTGRLAVPEVVRIGMQAALGLAAAHAQGIVHRDVKPANILLENGVERVKLTDFGLARAADDASLTQSGAVAGTPAYMSPEQAEGQPVDARSDLFSLGSVLYAMCAGRPPFRAGTSMATLKRVCEDAPKPLREANPDVPAWLAELIAKLHAKDPADRYQSAAEVADLLGRHLAHLQHPSVVPVPAAAKAGVKPAATAATPRRGRGWAVAAAILLCLVAGLGVAEATGTTKLKATVIRLFTPEGTLVVETDDPAVKVVVEGDGDLVITGAGAQEVRLRAGSYRLKATKDGRPVKLDRELVTISRGDREIVKVRLAGGAQTAPATPPAERGAFVVLGGKGVAERKFDSLAEAVARAGAGDTIEVRGDGPFVTAPIRCNHAITVRAGRGFRPLIRLRIDGQKTTDRILATESALVLEGLEFELAVQNDIELMPGGGAPAVVWTTKPLYVANCRFRNRGEVSVLETTGAVCQARNCEFLCAVAGAAVTAPARGGAQRLVLDNCLVTESLVINPTDTVVQLGRNTFRTRMHPIWLTTNLDTPPAKDAGRGKVLQVQATGNLFDAGSTILVFAGLPGGVNPEGGWEPLLANVVGWEGRRNVYPPAGPSVNLCPPPGNKYYLGPATQRLDGWRRVWKTTEAESIEGAVHYRDGDPLKKVEQAEHLTPEDFRLRADSAGYQKGEGKRDLGADVDLVGPGKAYEQWKATPDYPQWLKDSGQLRAEAPISEPGAFVVLGGKGVAERKFGTLAEAVQHAGDGDTIEVRGNGPFVAKPIQLGKTALAIRAAAGFRPVIQFVKAEADTQGRALWSDGPLVLEGLEIRFKASDPKTLGPLIRPGPSFFAANCRFLYAGSCVWNDHGAKRCVLRNCELLIDGCALGGHHPPGFQGLLDNCLIAGGALDTHIHPDLRGASLEFRRTTLVSEVVSNFYLEHRPEDAGERPEPRLRLKATASVLDVNHVVSTYQDKRSFADDKSLPFDKFESLLRRAQTWQGERNVYPSGEGVFRFNSGEDPGLYNRPHGPKDLAAWRKFWGSSETGAILDQVRYQGGDLRSRLADAPETLTPDDFRLRPDSAGYQAGEGKMDLGADVDLVGPGKAYETWKKAPDYQQWLKETGRK